ncbi:MAG: hypothetical protein A2008_01345 [Candidatus Wallbacteria bacterium GWC2_49_35]|uniref:GGDEF domain-containing protein n=1 Tax=Candidatus Wallbacteria bacterium GWC2_49_35 TaxID=1817813 RepID=A0A1F7WR62_9BACT|nr:MAG: hypothetical protein A2008_01345 [Candidatus Wallbacteria bacterium GWC2_49_35]HBC76412.1 hypothetical protein [Candidatus Wallbacteria bacterium]
MSGFEKMFITNELLSALAGSLSLNDAFKKIFIILETHLKIKGASVVIYNPADRNFIIQPGFQYKLSKAKILKLLSDQKFEFKNTEFFDISRHIVSDNIDAEMSYLYFPLFVNSRLSAMLLLHIKTAEVAESRIDANLVEAISTPISIIYERELLFNETKAQKNGFEFLHKLTNAINKTLDAESILRVSLKIICQTFESVVPVIAVSHANFRIVAAGSHKCFDLESNFGAILEQLKENLNEDVSEFSIIKETPKFKDDETEKKLRINTESSMWLSLNYNNNIYGYLGLFSSGSELEKLSVSAIRFLTLASNHIISAVENARLYNEVERLASIDGMTGVFNYRYFYSHLSTEIQRARRYSLALAVIMLDIDHFKSFNDMYGHQAGDDVLRATGKILNDEARKIDIVARYGGEEFILVAPETDLQGALGLAERIRDKIEKNNYIVKSKNGSLSLKVTVSIGVSSFTDPGACDNDTLIKAADDALYHAKHSGRNRVCYNESGDLKQFRRNQ